MKWLRHFYQPCLGLGQDGKRVSGSREHIALSRQAGAAFSDTAVLAICRFSGGMGCGYPEEMLAAVKRGDLTEDEIRLCAKRLIECILKLA